MNSPKTSKTKARKLGILGICAAMLLAIPLSTGAAQAKETKIEKPSFDPFNVTVKETITETIKQEDFRKETIIVIVKIIKIVKIIDVCHHETRSPECPPRYCFWQPDHCFHTSGCRF